MVHAFGVPFPEMLRLLRVLCQSSRSLALSLRTTVFERCLLYLSLKVEDRLLPVDMMQRLRSEAIRALASLAAYSVAREEFASNLPYLLDGWHSGGRMATERADFLILAKHLLSGCQASTDSAELLWQMVEQLVVEGLDNVSDDSCEFSAAVQCVSIYATRTGHGQNILLKVLQKCLSSVSDWVRSLRPHLLLAQLGSGCSVERLAPSSASDAGHEIWLRQIDEDGKQNIVQLQPARSHSSLPHLLAVVELTEAALVVDRSSYQQLLPCLLAQEDLVQLVRQLLLTWRPPSSPPTASHCWFIRWEVAWLARLAFLSCWPVSNSGWDRVLWARLAFFLLPFTRVGQEHLAVELVTRVLMSPELLQADTPLLQISTVELSDSVVEECVVNLAQDLADHLASIRATYHKALIKVLGGESLLQQSRLQLEQQVGQVENWQVSFFDESAMPVDWVYLPVLLAHQNQHEWQQCDLVNTLRWVHAQETWFQTATLTPTAHLARLMTALLADAQLCRDAIPRRLLSSLLQRLTRVEMLGRLDLNIPVPGLHSFYDLFVELLLQYSASSFGETVFGNVVLLPTAQRHPVHFRRALWSEHSAALRALRLAPADLLAPLSEWLNPRENQPAMVRLYTEALLSGIITADRTPLLFLIALHHANGFLYDQSPKPPPEEVELRDMLWHRVAQLRECPLRQYLLLYRFCDSHGALQFYDTLPPTRSRLLERLTISAPQLTQHDQ